MSDQHEHAELRNLYSRFSFTRDTHRHEEWVSLFEDDGVFDIDDGVFRGHDSLNRFSKTLEENLVAARVAIRHHVSDVEVTVKGDEATGRAYFEFYKVEEGIPTLAALGTYTDHFRRVQDGWKIAERKVRNITDLPFL
jgi:3-phenylpropionate/cinnamic acid dioxygenase small subunit